MVYWGGKSARPGSKPFHLDNQSLNGVILRVTHAGPDATIRLVAVVIVGIAGLATSILASRRGHELLVWLRRRDRPAGVPHQRVAPLR